jgi:hypothetical protein
MSIPTLLTLAAGKSASFARSTPNADGTTGGVFTGSETITSTLWPADSQTAVLIVSGSPNAWLAASATACSWVITYTDSQTGVLAPGFYRLQVSAPQSAGHTGVLFEGNLEVTSSAGSTVPIPPDLVTVPYVAKLLSEIPLTTAQWEALPDLISAASGAVRKWCNRNFTQANVTEDVAVELDGYCRLRAIPVNQVFRVQNQPGVALTVQNNIAQIAYIGWTMTGDIVGGQTITGMTAVSIANAVRTTQAVDYTSLPDQTINSLAEAIGALGNGWSALSDPVLGLYPVTEIIDGQTAKGACPLDTPNGWAEFNVFTSDINGYWFHPDYGQYTGLLCVGRQYNDISPRWGPDWGMWASPSTNDTGLVRVTYNGGYATIPLEVQLATVELVKITLERLKTDLILINEKAGQYSYTLSDKMLEMIPAHVRQALTLYKITNA